VQRTDALRDAGKRVPPAYRFRQGVVQHRFIQRPEHELAQGELRQAGRRRIHGRERLRQRLSRGNDPVTRVHHLRAEESRAHFAKSAHPLAFIRRTLELLLLAAVEVEEAQHEPFGVHHQLPLRAEFHFHLVHPSLDQHGLAGRCRIRRREAGFVFVAMRQMQREIVLRPQAELGKLLFDRGRWFFLQPAYRMQSISTSAPRGRLATPIAAREGYGWPTYCAMISFTLAK